MGATVLGTERRGDLLVRIQVVTPTDMTEEQRELLRQFASCAVNPSPKVRRSSTAAVSSPA